jgi:hypothetical protein
MRFKMADSIKIGDRVKSRYYSTNLRGRVIEEHAYLKIAYGQQWLVVMWDNGSRSDAYADDLLVINALERLAEEA